MTRRPSDPIDDHVVQSSISERFGQVAEGFTARVVAVPESAWENPAPCEGWVARDVVRHLVEWLSPPGFLLGTFGVERNVEPFGG